MNTRVCAITISYNPDLGMLHGQLRSLSGQCRVVVVDNGSAGNMEQSLGELCAEHAAGFLALHDNYGIARAQNAGVAFAREQYPDCEYLLFLDHDSVPDAGFVDALPTAFLKPLSGSGARAMMLETMSTHGVDSFAALTAASIQGSTETTFYVLAVYFGSVNIKNTRHALPVGLIADIAGILGALFIVRLLFSG